MGSPGACALLALALLATACSAAASSLLDLPLSVNTLPGDCGYVLTVRQGDTCQTLADFGGISLKKYMRLNPLALCGILAPAPGALTCVGDKLSFCSNYYRSVPGDSCDNIKSRLGRGCALLGASDGVPCASLVPNTQMCVRPTANQCDVDSLCGVKLDDGMRELLGMLPDWCTVVSECQAAVSAPMLNSLPALVATITDVTPAISAVVGNDGHPELREFVKQRTAGPAQLQLALVPNAQGDGQHSINFAISPGGNGRKLLVTAPVQGSARAQRY